MGPRRSADAKHECLMDGGGARTCKICEFAPGIGARHIVRARVCTVKWRCDGILTTALWYFITSFHCTRTTNFTAAATTQNVERPMKNNIINRGTGAAYFKNSSSNITKSRCHVWRVCACKTPEIVTSAKSCQCLFWKLLLQFVQQIDQWQLI